jgi:hypothetical protein
MVSAWCQDGVRMALEWSPKGPLMALQSVVSGSMGAVTLKRELRIAKRSMFYMDACMSLNDINVEVLYWVKVVAE